MSKSIFIDEVIFRFWGKASVDKYHPALCHMIDVGIMANELLEVQTPRIKKRLYSLFGDSTGSGLSFITALHDIGKISPGFQIKRQDLAQPLKAHNFDFPRFAETNHGKIASYCLPSILQEEMNCPEDLASIISLILAAHHGVFAYCDTVIDGTPRWNESRKAITSRMFP